MGQKGAKAPQFYRVRLPYFHRATNSAVGRASEPAYANLPG